MISLLVTTLKTLGSYNTMKAVNFNIQQKTETDLQVDDDAELAEMLIEFADVVELRGNLPNQQLGVGGIEGGSLLVALVVGLVEVVSEQKRHIMTP